MCVPPTESPTVVSIHDHEIAEALNFDLKDIVAALGERAREWHWCFSDFEAYGPDEALRELALAFQRSPTQHMWRSGPEFVRLVQGIDQTIDGKFQAFGGSVDPQSIACEELGVPFAQSRAELVIKISDGAIFEVFAKHPEDIDQLRIRFVDVRQEDPAPSP
jgi:hypothetical protein